MKQDSIREISCNPFQEEIFISATDGGRITLHDTRAKPASVVRTSRAQDAIQLDKEVTGVQYHPQTEHLFVTSDGRGRVALRDTRTGFGSRKERSDNGVVLNVRLLTPNNRVALKPEVLISSPQYNTKLSRRDTAHLSNPESSSVTFNADGSQLAITMLHYYPTLFKLSDPDPLAFFTGRNTPDGAPFPDGQRTYANSCTMKHGSFGGPPDDLGVNYYCAGSDNFCGYLWKIPPIEELISMREEISFHDWYRKDSRTIGFTKKSNSTRYIPHELSTPAAILKGHDSIVNTAVMHPHLPLIATAGIERDICLHSPTPSAPFMHDMKLTPTEVRQLRKESTQEERDALLQNLLLDASDHDVDDREEQETINLFDSMLRMDGLPDPFNVRKWVDDDEDSE
ncbi:hypothetical protein AAF712_003778 [Marasmius tenuissimus]|uniref:Uncharacterized protein n=1 Tax=Marasmius tenuissimus TaxID=585030 RepID=A0ABR3A554_9AGAR